MPISIHLLLEKYINKIDVINDKENKHITKQQRKKVEEEDNKEIINGIKENIKLMLFNDRDILMKTRRLIRQSENKK